MGVRRSLGSMRTTTAAHFAAVLLSTVLLAACGADSLLPDEYRATYTEVRDCRQSGDHDLHSVRVLADPEALAAYSDRSTPFPMGATIVKEEYEFGDDTCAGPIVAWTLMQKLEVGASPSNLDWTWQSIDADGAVLATDPPRCANCHQDCVPPDGYDGTCTVP